MQRDGALDINVFTHSGAWLTLSHVPSRAAESKSIMHIIDRVIWSVLVQAWLGKKAVLVMHAGADGKDSEAEAPA